VGKDRRWEVEKVGRWGKDRRWEGFSISACDELSRVEVGPVVVPKERDFRLRLRLRRDKMPRLKMRPSAGSGGTKWEIKEGGRGAELMGHGVGFFGGWHTAQKVAAGFIPAFSGIMYRGSPDSYPVVDYSV
jgi:hypothetical protein